MCAIVPVKVCLQASAVYLLSVFVAAADMIGTQNSARVKSWTVATSGVPLAQVELNSPGEFLVLCDVRATFAALVRTQPPPGELPCCSRERVRTLLQYKKAKRAPQHRKTNKWYY